MAHVTLDGNGNVTGLFANPQPELTGYAELADNDPRLAAFLNPASAQLAVKLASGIAITSTGTPAINGTYALDAGTQADMANIAATCAFTGGFPGGGASFAYPDITGAPKTFPSVAALKAFYIAYSTLVLQMQQTEATLTAGGQAAWPSQSVAIA